ncbi:hypothetical protein AM461_07945 [Providencia rettgeri]|nr:hypothetical protein AM461_07945 [Providencia rettgeri]
MDSCKNQLERIDNGLVNESDLSPEVLALMVSQQKQVVLAMLGINVEDEIALRLIGSIEIYSLKLQKIYGWTQGGVEMFRSSLMLMFEDIKKDGVKSTDLEDLFQLALLEIMTNAEEYGLENWYSKNKEHISHVLESTGSGSHSLHEKDYDSPKKMADHVSRLYESLKKEGNIPPESFLGQIMAELDKMGGSKALSDQIINGWDSDYGWWVEKPSKNGEKSKTRADNISPMLRLFTLSSLLHEKPMSKEQVEILLTGSLAEIDEFIMSNFDVNTSKHESATLAYLVNNTNWDLQYKNGIYQIDWVGNGISLNDLNNLYKEFPGRELSEDEIEEMNRIGDQVKMLQQTLKYWTQICRDQQLAILRNI